jgi:benzoylformate decarboxylase
MAIIDRTQNLITPEITSLIKERLNQLKAEWEEKESKKAEQIQAAWGKIPIKVEQVVKEINEVADSNTVIVDEAIRSSRPLLQHYHFTQPGTYHRSPAGYLGWGLPAALGVKLAQPNRLVIAFVGDGAFIISNQALWTAARYDIPITIIVCNNREYKAVKDAAIRFKGKAVEKNIFIGSSIDKPAPKLSQIAEGFGISATTIKDPAEIRPVLEKALRSGKSSVVDIWIEQ